MLLMVDIETTGLDLDNDRLLEYAFWLVDNDLVRVHTSVTGVLSMTPHEVDELRVKNPYVYAMHQKSGLLTECLASTHTSSEAVRGVCCWLDQLKNIFHTHNNITAGTMKMCGSGVQFDRDFLRRKPGWNVIVDWFHYRNIDVSTQRTLMEMWRPELNLPHDKTKDAHRANDDLDATLGQLRYFRKVLYTDPFLET